MLPFLVAEFHLRVAARSALWIFSACFNNEKKSTKQASHAVKQASISLE
jgi:hypothetical protein